MRPALTESVTLTPKHIDIFIFLERGECRLSNDTKTMSLLKTMRKLCGVIQQETQKCSFEKKAFKKNVPL